jgi:hypothetical protein
MNDYRSLGSDENMSDDEDEENASRDDIGTGWDML